MLLFSAAGEVAERSNAAVLKTVEGIPLPGFESLPLRQKIFQGHQ